MRRAALALAVALVAATATDAARLTSGALDTGATLAGGRASGGVLHPPGGAAACTLPTNTEIQLKASNLALSDSDPVTSWTSTGSDTIAFTQATGSKQPTYVADCTGIGLSSGPCVSFDGGDVLFGTMTSSTATTWTVGCVFETDSAAAVSHTFSSSAWFYHQSNACRGYAAGAEIGLFQHTLASDTWTSCTMRFDNGSPIYYSSTDGLLTTDATNDDIGTNVYSTIAVGARTNETLFLTGHIVECLLVDDDDADTAEAMHDYFACEYSL